MRKLIKFAAALVVASFTFNTVWEYLHLPLYTGYEHLGTGWPLILWATSGDVLYTLLIVGFVFLCFTEDSPRRYVALGIGGFLCAMFIEHKALVLHKWAYTTEMPTLWGVGLSPLLQLTLLIPLSVYVAGRLTR